MYIILASLLLSSAHARSWQPLPVDHINCHIQNTDFLEPVETLTQLGLPLTAMGGSPKIEILNASGKVLQICSSNVVSDEGTILTAGHCIDACLNSAAVIEKRDGILRVNKEKLSSVKCKIRVNGEMTEFEVLATNDCRGAKNWKNGAPEECGADFAILKLADNKILKNAKCFQVGGRDAQGGAKVATIGYPGATHRKTLKADAKDSDGERQYVSFGQTQGFSATCSTLVDSYNGVPYDAKMTDHLPVALFKARTESGASIQTTVDITPGNSGGGLIDVTTGEILGMASINVMPNQFRECKGASFFSSTKEMRSILARDYPNLNLRQVFGCDKNALVRTPNI